MSELQWILSLEPIARAVVLRVASSSDGALLDVGIRGAGGRRLVFGVKWLAIEGEVTLVTVEPFAQFIAANGSMNLGEAGEGDDLDLVADAAGELRILVGGRVRVAVPVTLRSAGGAPLGVRFTSPVDSRPTVPDLHAA